MCTIAILFGVAENPLILAANRDELYARDARGPTVLQGSPRVVGGLDVVSGGTWLALRADGRFAAVTNQRALEPIAPGLRSRGLAVRELAAADDQDAYVAALDPRRYASMNLVWGDADHVSIAYARRDGAMEVERLPHGVHVLCNDRLGASGFPRGERFATAIAHALARSRAWPELSRSLASGLGDHTRVPLDQVPASHLPIELSRELTATCIHSDHYGTRSATLAAIDHGAVHAYLHADGSPCVTPLSDRTELLRGRRGIPGGG
ncbi:MAG: hypothetical protein JWO36_1627 [Myxococcales bacterium]|nr:hypothetical protein [Myxococcales bacterium]